LVATIEKLSSPVVKKDSHNSSLPPSHDLVPVTKSLRTKSLLSCGGQLGHKGSTLKQKEVADVVIDLKADVCSGCGCSLLDEVHVKKQFRQVIDIPPIVPIYTEYCQYVSSCPCCQTVNSGAFPLGVNAPVQYGSSIETLVSYLSVYQYLPFRRLSQFFADVFNLRVSEGTIGNLLERSSEKCSGVYEAIKQEIQASEVVGSDETGAKVDGKKWWIWVWQTVTCTFIAASKNRGYETIERIWGDSLANANLITDRWAAQLKTSVLDNQLCLAHLLRNVIFLIEAEKHPFATQFKQFLLDIFDAKKQSISENFAFNKQHTTTILLEQQLNTLISIPIDKDLFPKTAIFQASMIQYRNSILPCLYNLQIPPDNNASERAIRNIKVKQKVSGQFKTGQEAFCVIRSVIDTLRKRGLNVFINLNNIIKYKQTNINTG
jgi:transposase